MDEEQTKLQIDAYTYHFFFNHGVFDELKHYEDLIVETESFLKGKSFSMEIENADERFGKKTQYETVFPIILWKSLFLSSYFLLENSLDQICKNLQKSNSYGLSLNDISGNGIFRSCIYLKKVCNVVEPFKTNTWAEITDFNKIRNVLVHSDGILPRSNTAIIKVCEKYSQISISEYDENSFFIQFDNKYCKYSLWQIEKLIVEIHTEMKKVKTSH